jgi:ADP-heptose:LPS heptosyltransferase
MASPKAPRKILILRFSSIGDIVLTTPVLRCLKHQIPESEIHYCTKSQFSFLLEENPYVDRIWTLEGSLWELAVALRRERFDVVIDLHHNLRTLCLKILLGAVSYSFPKLNIEKFLYVHFKIDRMPNKHIVDRYMQTVEALGVKNDGNGLDYFIPDRDQVEKAWLPESHQKSFVAVVIGAQHGTKKLPKEKLIELCDKINKPIVLLGGPDETEMAETIVRFFDRPPEHADYEPGLKELNKKTQIFNGCGKFNFNQSASLVQQSMVVFSHDTGLMHVAAAFKKQVYSIWGNTSPKFGMYPYETRFVVFENNRISCRPCSKIGYKICPKGHFKCMRDLNFEFYLP